MVPTVIETLIDRRGFAVEALLDCGATGCYIDDGLWWRRVYQQNDSEGLYSLQCRWNTQRGRTNNPHSCTSTPDKGPHRSFQVCGHKLLHSPSSHSSPSTPAEGIPHSNGQQSNVKSPVFQLTLGLCLCNQLNNYICFPSVCDCKPEKLCVVLYLESEGNHAGDWSSLIVHPIYIVDWYRPWESFCW